MNRRSHRTGAQEFTAPEVPYYTQQSVRRWLTAHVRDYPGLIAAGVLGKVIAVALVSVSALLIGALLNVARSPDQPLESLLMWGGALLGAAVAQGLIQLGSSFALQTLGQRLQRDARREVFHDLLGKSQTFQLRQQPGDLSARLTADVQSLSSMVYPGISMVGDALLNASIPLVAVAVLDPRLLLVPSLFVLLLLVGLWRYNRSLDGVTRDLQQSYSALSAQLEEAVSGVETVKTVGREPHERARFDALARAHHDLSVRFGQIEAAFVPKLIYGLAFAAAIWHALTLLQQGALLAGEVIAFATLLVQLRYPVSTSSYSFALIQQGYSGARRLLALMRTQADLDQNSAGHTDTLRGSVSFTNATLRLGGKTVLDGVTVSIGAGECVALTRSDRRGKNSL